MDPLGVKCEPRKKNSVEERDMEDREQGIVAEGNDMRGGRSRKKKGLTNLIK